MKKLIAVLLASVMVFILFAPVYAAQADDIPEADNAETVTEFQRVTPEEVGIPSGAILDFLDAVQELPNELDAEGSVSY